VKSLHSRYDPQGEAERYLAAVPIPPETRCFVLIEPGLGYMIPVLARRFPEARIIALHLAPPGEGGIPAFSDSPAFSDFSTGQDSEAVHWYPGGGPGPEDFLDRELEKADRGGLLGTAESIKIIEWRPALNYYGKLYAEVLAAAAAAIRRFDAGRRTLRAFGHRWFRNFFRNLALLRRFPVYRELTIPVLVTGAGPSLEDSLPLIREVREGGCFIIAASSSFMALSKGGIVPDLVLSTDGGPWALLHLYELFRGLNPPAIAAAFSAGLPSQCGDLPLLGISDGSLWQGLILRGLGIPHLILPQRGTVTATALDLAFALGRGKVCIAGMDLDTQDIRSHCRPYSFDRLQREGASRFYTEYGRLFSRCFAMKEGGSHRVYAEWFAGRLASYAGRLYTLGKNNPLFADLPRAAPGTLWPGEEKSGGGALIRLAPVKAPVAAALEILRAGLEDRKTGPALSEELGPLLLPGVKNAGTGELWETVESLTGGSGGGPHG
jgi:hypothetical protein